MKTLVLFDIDGTLIVTAHAGVRSMNAAFERLYGVRDALEGIAIAGRTDRAILFDAFEKVGAPFTAESFEEMREVYYDALAAEMGRPPAQPAAPFGVLPGVQAILTALEADARWVIGLLTGNFVRSAEIKLGHFNLWRRFAFGAFGDDHLNRRDLMPVAMGRAAAAGVVPDRVVVLGDTPLDVDCAKAYGALAVAVATGNYGPEELARSGADLVVDRLDQLGVADLSRLVAAAS